MRLLRHGAATCGRVLRTRGLVTRQRPSSSGLMRAKRSSLRTAGRDEIDGVVEILSHCGWLVGVSSGVGGVVAFGGVGGGCRWWRWWRWWRRWWRWWRWWWRWWRWWLVALVALVALVVGVGGVGGVRWWWWWRWWRAWSLVALVALVVVACGVGGVGGVVALVAASGWWRGGVRWCWWRYRRWRWRWWRRWSSLVALVVALAWRWRGVGAARWRWRWGVSGGVVAWRRVASARHRARHFAPLHRDRRSKRRAAGAAETCCASTSSPPVTGGVSCASRRSARSRRGIPAPRSGWTAPEQRATARRAGGWRGRCAACMRDAPFGAPTWITRSTSPQSMPRSRVEVQTTARSLPAAIAASTLRRCSTSSEP